MLNKKKQINKKMYQCHSGRPKHVILNLIQDLNRDAECPQHDNRVAQSGRSMVEMLGVLAVMGLLTIIGIVGFRYALNRHYANDLLHEVHRVAYSYSGHLLTSGNGASFDINSVAPASANVSFTLKPYDDYFMVGTENIEKAVCEQAAGTELPVSFQRRVYCDEGAIEFYFANEMGACDEEEKCALPEVCTEGQNQCGRLCCEQGETCMPGRCCPSGKYIVATNTCCEGDEVAYDTTGQGNYVCKEPEEGDSCMGTNGPDQSKCNLSGEEKLYCKVTSNTCPPTSATCQEVPTPGQVDLTFAGHSVGIWKMSDVDMDWWSAQNYCDALEMELTSLEGFCNGASDCYTQATGWRVFQTLVGNRTAWFSNSVSNCNARAFAPNTYGGIPASVAKTSNRRAVCQPINYQEPDPICPDNGYYSKSYDMCGLQCEDYHICQERLGNNYYCKMDIASVATSCTATPKGLCTQRPTYQNKILTFAQGTVPMGNDTWVKSDVNLDWWSAKDFCASLGKELPTFASFSNGNISFNGQATPSRIRQELGFGETSNAAWLDNDANSSCKAYAAHSGRWAGIGYSKGDAHNTICQPIGYTEPDPICQAGTYDISSNTCQ